MAEGMEGKEKIINDTDSGLADLIDDGGINWGREHRRKNRYRRNEEFRLDFTAFVAGPEHPQGNTWVRSINLELREKKGRIQFWDWSGCFNWALPLPWAPYFLYAIALVLHCNLQTTVPPSILKNPKIFWSSYHQMIPLLPLLVIAIQDLLGHVFIPWRFDHNSRHNSHEYQNWPFQHPGLSIPWSSFLQRPCLPPRLSHPILDQELSTLPTY